MFDNPCCEEIFHSCTVDIKPAEKAEQFMIFAWDASETKEKAVSQKPGKKIAMWYEQIRDIKRV